MSLRGGVHLENFKLFVNNLLSHVEVILGLVEGGVLKSLEEHPGTLSAWVPSLHFKAFDETLLQKFRITSNRGGPLNSF